MPHPLDPRDYRVIPAWKYLNGKAQKLPRNWWTFAGVYIALLVLVPRLWWLPVGGTALLLIKWLVNVVRHRSTKF